MGRISLMVGLAPCTRQNHSTMLLRDTPLSHSSTLIAAGPCWGTGSRGRVGYSSLTIGQRAQLDKDGSFTCFPHSCWKFFCSTIEATRKNTHTLNFDRNISVSSHELVFRETARFCPKLQSSHVSFLKLNQQNGTTTAKNLPQLEDKLVLTKTRTWMKNTGRTVNTLGFSPVSWSRATREWTTHTTTVFRAVLSSCDGERQSHRLARNDGGRTRHVWQKRSSSTSTACNTCGSAEMKFVWVARRGNRRNTVGNLFSEPVRLESVVSVVRCQRQTVRVRSNRRSGC